MSATWIRAQAFGQPLMLMVIGSSNSGRRRSSSSISAAPRALVSTMASLQYSMPVQAIVPRRNGDGLDLAGPSASRPATSDSTRSCVDVEDDHLLLDGGAHPARAVRLGQLGDLGRGWRRPRGRRAARSRRRSGRPAARCTPTWSRQRLHGLLGRGAVDQLALRGTRPPAPGGTSPRPSRRPGTSAGRGCAAAGSRSRGRSPTTPAQTSGDLVQRHPGAEPLRRASGWWTGRRRPRGRSRGRARGARRRRTRCR